MRFSSFHLHCLSYSCGFFESGGVFQVLMFPFFFDDMSLCTEFEKFIESIDNIHELAFAENQEFPV